MLPPLCLRYTFSDLLSREILKLRESIQDQSSDELTVNFYECETTIISFVCFLQDFLADVREKSIYIGEVAMHQVLYSVSCIGPHIAISLLQAARQWNLDLAQDIHSLLDEAKAPDPDVCAQDLIDFSPVYRCLHIHTVLVRPFMVYPCCVMLLTTCRGRESSSLRTIAVADAVKYGWPSSLVVYGYAGALSVGVICYVILSADTQKGEISDFKCYFYGIMG